MGTTPRPTSDAGHDPVRIYLDEIGRRPLLTKDEEATLGEQVRAGIVARDRLNTNEGTLSAAERRQLRNAVRAGEVATEIFIESNLRLVVSIARKYQHSGLPLLDLIQEGNLGLIHAVEKFDHRKGFKFSTYATWWIRQAITRGTSNSARIIRMPVHAEEVLRAHDRARLRLEGELQREPTLEEIAADIHVPVTKIQDVLATGRVVTSTDAPMGEEADTTFGDMHAVADDDPEEEALQEARRAEVRCALDALDERERKILILRHGLDCGQGRTLEEVAGEFGLTRERIRQIEARALSKLRHPTLVANLGA